MSDCLRPSCLGHFFCSPSIFESVTHLPAMARITFTLGSPGDTALVSAFVAEHKERLGALTVAYEDPDTFLESLCAPHSVLPIFVVRLVLALTFLLSAPSASWSIMIMLICCLLASSNGSVHSHRAPSGPWPSNYPLQSLFSSSAGDTEKQALLNEIAALKVRLHLVLM